MQEAFNTARFDNGVTTVNPLHYTVDQVLLAIKEVTDDLLALGITDFLQNDLFGSLCTNAAEFNVFQRIFDVVADFDIGNLVLGVNQQDLEALGFQLGFGYNQPTAEGFVFTGFAVNRHAHVGFILEAFLGSRGERLLQRLEHDFFAYALFACQCIGKHQHFTAHNPSSACFKPSVSSEQHPHFSNRPKFLFRRRSTSLHRLQGQPVHPPSAADYPSAPSA